MTNTAEYLTKNQDRLIDIAIWAKTLSWIVLVVFILLSLLEFLQSTFFSFDLHGRNPSFMWLLVNDPIYLMLQAVRPLSILLKGLTFYVVLKAISVGLNMIAETDINYREQKEYGGGL
jgi:hypothetical protein